MRANRTGMRAGLTTVMTSGAVLLIGAVCIGAAPAPTDINDFFGPGTQPGDLGSQVIQSSSKCSSCHGGYSLLYEPQRLWAASMHGQAQRDPLYLASLTIANQDATDSGDLCLRCHTPGGWLAGRSTPTDGSALIAIDREGVNCNFCHRMVDPVYVPGVSPVEDDAILNALAFAPTSAHSGHYVVDTQDRRRGPFDLGSFSRHEWLESPFHTMSDACATCHDVSNPAFTAQPDGTYTLNTIKTAHPSDDKLDQFPVERTFSEWAQSAFAAGPIEMGGRFGGNKTAVSTCQDCHMPDKTGQGAKNVAFRADMPAHYFNGGNTWMLNAVRNLYPDSETGLEDQAVADSIARTIDRLENASDMELTQNGSDLNVRVINMTGHKLPTGYPEGRRMWINVEFYDSGGVEIAEFGHYDDSTATLTTSDTKVYEAKLGVSAALGATLGVPSGPGFHFAISNEWFKDNRIPPMGFTNAGFEAVQAAPVAYTYADGQYWDDTLYAIPSGAATAEVSVFYQSVSKEFIEFLRDENMTDSTGQTAYDQWVATGKSEPVLMDYGTLELASTCQADMNGDGILDFFDVGAFLTAFNNGDLAADFNGDGVLDFFDVGAFLTQFNAGCP